MESKQEDIQVMSFYTSRMSDISTVRDSEKAVIDFDGAFELENMYTDIAS